MCYFDVKQLLAAANISITSETLSDGIDIYTKVPQEVFGKVYEYLSSAKTDDNLFGTNCKMLTNCVDRCMETSYSAKWSVQAIKI